MPTQVAFTGFVDAPLPWRADWAVVRQNLKPRAILTARDDPRHGKGFAQQVPIAAHRPGLFENRAEGSTHRVET